MCRCIGSGVFMIGGGVAAVFMGIGLINLLEDANWQLEESCILNGIIGSRAYSTCRIIDDVEVCTPHVQKQLHFSWDGGGGLYDACDDNVLVKVNSQELTDAVWSKCFDGTCNSQCGSACGECSEYCWKSPNTTCPTSLTDRYAAVEARIGALVFARGWEAAGCAHKKDCSGENCEVRIDVVTSDDAVMTIIRAILIFLGTLVVVVGFCCFPHVYYYAYVWIMGRCFKEYREDIPPVQESSWMGNLLRSVLQSPASRRCGVILRKTRVCQVITSLCIILAIFGIGVAVMVDVQGCDECRFFQNVAKPDCRVLLYPKDTKGVSINMGSVSFGVDTGMEIRPDNLVLQDPNLNPSFQHRAASGVRMLGEDCNMIMLTRPGSPLAQARKLELAPSGNNISLGSPISFPGCFERGRTAYNGQDLLHESKELFRLDWLMSSIVVWSLLKLFCFSVPHILEALSTETWSKILLCFTGGREELGEKTLKKKRAIKAALQIYFTWVMFLADSMIAPFTEFSMNDACPLLLQINIPSNDWNGQNFHLWSFICAGIAMGNLVFLMIWLLIVKLGAAYCNTPFIREGVLCLLCLFGISVLFTTGLQVVYLLLTIVSKGLGSMFLLFSFEFVFKWTWFKYDLQANLCFFHLLTFMLCLLQYLSTISLINSSMEKGIADNEGEAAHGAAPDMVGVQRL